MRERITDLLYEWSARLAEWAARKVCRHEALTEMREIRCQDGPCVHWTRIHECRACGEILGLEAYFKGVPSELLEVIEKEV